MERLIVKNFGPITHADINLKEVTVFIGPTGSGKSTMAKLAAIMKRVPNAVSNPDIFRQFLFDYNIPSYLKDESRIRYEFNRNNSEYFWEFRNAKIESNYPFLGVNEYDLFVTTGTNQGDAILNFKMEETLTKFKRLDLKLLKNKLLTDLVTKFIAECETYLKTIIDKKTMQVDKAADKFSELSNALHQQIGPYMKSSSPLYIPSERNIASIFPGLIYVQSGIAGSGQRQLPIPRYLLDFLTTVTSARYPSGKYFSIDEIGIAFGMEEDKTIYLYGKDKGIDIREAASGIQTVMPLAKLLCDYNLILYNYYLIEEPELNLFPEHQDGLVKFIVKYCNKKDYDVLLTTHSPYILTSLDNLILAKNVADEKPHLIDAVNELVPKDYWLDYENVSVYYFNPNPKDNETNSQNILNADRKGIMGNAIDRVSEQLSNVFDSLTNLRYS
jgi:energy-coupling factor transporter ATP-binding protein EcfA2